MPFSGCYTALVTPFTDTGGVDFSALSCLVDYQIDNEVDGLVVLGTTGENATLSPQERFQILKHVITNVDSRKPIVAGTAGMTPSAALALIDEAAGLGADAALVMTPPYVRPPQHGLIAYYQAIADASKLPLLLYNVPSRTACDCLTPTTALLSQHPNIIGIKEAVGSAQRASELLQATERGFSVLSGDDAATFAMMRAGASGVVSVTANVAPKRMRQFCNHMLQQHFSQAQDIDDALQPLHRELFCETNPIAVKWALHQLLDISPHCRLPLMRLDAQYHQRIEDLLPLMETR